MTGTPDRYHTLCAESFMAEVQSHVELERHFQTCEECKKLEPGMCEQALKIVEESINTKEKTT